MRVKLMVFVIFFICISRFENPTAVQKVTDVLVWRGHLGVRMFLHYSLRNQPWCLRMVPIVLCIAEFAIFMAKNY